MRYFKAGILLFISTLLFVGNATAQQTDTASDSGKKKLPQVKPKKKKVDPSSIEDAELKKFARAANEAQALQLTAKKKVQGMVEEEGMNFKRFRKIMMSKRNPKMGNKVDVSKEEQVKLDSLKPKLQKVQTETQKKITEKIKEHGLTMQRFQEIFRALRQNKKLVKRYKKIRKQVMQEDQQKKKQMKNQKNGDKDN